MLLILLVDPWPDQDEMKTLTPSTVSLFDSLRPSYTDLQADLRVDCQQLGKAWRTSPVAILPGGEFKPLPHIDGDGRH